MINRVAAVHWSHSVGITLFRAVFLVYCLVAVSTTIASLTMEYDKSRQDVNIQLQLLQGAFRKALVHAVWELDQPQIWSIMNGMQTNPVVDGVVVVDAMGHTIGRMGQIPQGEAARPLTHLVGSLPSLTNAATTTDASLMRHSFDLQLQWEGKQQLIGTVHLYWSYETILKEVRFEFYLIVVGSLIKTVALWLIFIYYARSMLQQPLMVLTKVTQTLDHPHLDMSTVQRLTNERFNEFNVLEHCFYAMADRLNTAYANLAERNHQLSLEIEQRRKSEQELLISRERLQKLSHHLEDVRETEQKRLAGEIHDQLGSTLTAAKISLSMLGKRQQDEANWQHCQEICQLTDEALQSVRRIAQLLRPNVLDRMGLRAALEELAYFTHRHSGVDCRLDMEDGEWLIDDAQRTALFRIAQESLTNVVRHAGASHAVVTLREEQGFIVLKISDDGCGIAVERVQDTGSFGLTGMRERAERLGGRVSVTTTIAGGTCVTARIPVQHGTDVV
ncbi:MAG: sensor histidine kinase [Magnetococcales bacterium]|nr:sensor histidine kinase [Magnetococcales bacterium]